MSLVLVILIKQQDTTAKSQDTQPFPPPTTALCSDNCNNALTGKALACEAHKNISPSPGALSRYTLASIFWKGVE